uniref:Uncharacterized protein n=1 Tax=Timema douglasi TaxID=61478 RepID=A0A7R8Z526_TIMDO|nr:unnamed protein product [Timema douglasi]
MVHAKCRSPAIKEKGDSLVYTPNDDNPGLGYFEKLDPGPARPQKRVYHILNLTEASRRYLSQVESINTGADTYYAISGPGCQKMTLAFVSNCTVGSRCSRGSDCPISTDSCACHANNARCEHNTGNWWKEGLGEWGVNTHGPLYRRDEMIIVGFHYTAPSVIITQSNDTTLVAETVRHTLIPSERLPTDMKGQGFDPRLGTECFTGIMYITVYRNDPSLSVTRMQYVPKATLILMACDVGRPGNDAHMYIDWETYAVMGIKAMKSFSRPRGDNNIVLHSIALSRTPLPPPYPAVGSDSIVYLPSKLVQALNISVPSLYNILDPAKVTLLLRGVLQIAESAITWSGRQKTMQVRATSAIWPLRIRQTAKNGLRPYQLFRADTASESKPLSANRQLSGVVDNTLGKRGFILYRSHEAFSSSPETSALKISQTSAASIGLLRTPDGSVDCCEGSLSCTVCVRSLRPIALIGLVGGVVEGGRQIGLNGDLHLDCCDTPT